MRLVLIVLACLSLVGAQLHVKTDSGSKKEDKKPSTGRISLPTPDLASTKTKILTTQQGTLRTKTQQGSTPQGQSTVPAPAPGPEVYPPSGPLYVPPPQIVGPPTYTCANGGDPNEFFCCNVSKPGQIAKMRCPAKCQGKDIVVHMHVSWCICNRCAASEWIPQTNGLDGLLAPSPSIPNRVPLPTRREFHSPSIQKKYCKAPDSKSCPPSREITDESECRIASAQLGYRFEYALDSNELRSYDPTPPPGCFWVEDGMGKSSDLNLSKKRSAEYSSGLGGICRCEDDVKPKEPTTSGCGSCSGCLMSSGNGKSCAPAGVRWVGSENGRRLDSAVCTGVFGGTWCGAVVSPSRSVVSPSRSVGSPSPPSQGACTITIGSSTTNRKEMTVPAGTQCRTYAGDIGTRVNTDYELAQDSFRISVSGTTLTARRTDLQTGWGQHLQIRCDRCGTNQIIESAPGVGGWGGSCTCPDGSVYQVGDNNDSCGSMACIGGTTSARETGSGQGTCNRRDGEWSHRKVICAGGGPTKCPTISTNSRCGPTYGTCPGLDDGQGNSLLYCSDFGWCGDTSAHQAGTINHAYDSSKIPEGCPGNVDGSDGMPDMGGPPLWLLRSDPWTSADVAKVTILIIVVVIVTCWCLATEYGWCGLDKLVAQDPETGALTTSTSGTFMGDVLASTFRFNGRSGQVRSAEQQQQTGAPSNETDSYTMMESESEETSEVPPPQHKKDGADAGGQVHVNMTSFLPGGPQQPLLLTQPELKPVGPSNAQFPRNQPVQSPVSPQPQHVHYVPKPVYHQPHLQTYPPRPVIYRVQPQPQSQVNGYVQAPPQNVGHFVNFENRQMFGQRDQRQTVYRPPAYPSFPDQHQQGQV